MVDPVRVMKGIFLINQESPRHWLPAEARYKFEPYLCGPFAVGVYHDLERLTDLGYALMNLGAERSWRITPAGRELAKSALGDLPPGLQTYIQEVRGFVSSVSFRELLNAVYDKYPKFATRSVFRR